MQSLTRCIFLFPLFLYHQQVMELEAILVVGQANLATHEVQEVRLVEIDNWYYLLLLFSCVISWD